MADLGKILLMPKGEYSASYTYSYLDVVTYQRSSYVCKVGSSLNVVPTNTTNWQLLSPHGEDAYGFGYIRYSEYSDGTDFVSTPTSETKYVGFYMGNSPTPPTDKEDYDWSKFVGENGQDGSDGQNGNVWGTGTDITTTGTRLHGYAGVIGDCYLNTETSNVYQCTKAGTSSTAEWSYICNIKGASGSGSGDMDKATYASNAVAQGLSNVVDNALGLYGLTATIAELNYVDGVTSNVQTQIDGKIDSPVSSVGADKVPVSKSGGGYEWKEYGGGGSGVEIDDSTTSSSKVWSSSKTNTAIEAHHDSTKVDVVSGKVLSDNNYSNADKAIVGGVTSALEGKIANPSTKQTNDVLTFNGTNWVAQAPSGGGHEMLDTIAEVQALEDGDDNYVVNAFVVQKWSNVSITRLITASPIAQGSTTTGGSIDDDTCTGWWQDNNLIGVDEDRIDTLFDVPEVGTSGASTFVAPIVTKLRVNSTTGHVCLQFGEPLKQATTFALDITVLR